MTKGERVEAVRHLALAGLSDSQIAVQLRIQVRSVERLRAGNEIACGRSSRPAARHERRSEGGVRERRLDGNDD